MKLKRLFTAILSAALTLSLCAMPAMATEGGTTAGTPLALSMLKSSQNYTYHQINEDSSTDTTLDFKKGLLATVGTSQTSHSLETVKTYNDALLVKETKTPNDHQESHQLKLLSESIKVKTK